MNAANRINRCFADLATQRRKGLITFVTAGDPHPDYMVTMLHALAQAGSDVIELGVPFSDPMADGPVIQRASERALSHNVGLKQIFDWVTEFRSLDAKTPIVLMGYLNPIEAYGYELFVKNAKIAGIDGVLLVDCPLEESEITAKLHAGGLNQVFLAAPTTMNARLQALAQATDGFLYYVSFAGTTGANKLDIDFVRKHVALVRQGTRCPIAVGFGVRDPASAAAIAEFADAVVVGSALVDCLAGSGSEQDATARITAFMAPFRVALDGVKAGHVA